MIAAQFWKSLETYSEHGLEVLDLNGVSPQSSNPEYKAARDFEILDIFRVLGELEFGSVSVVNSNSIDLLYLTLSRYL